MPSVGRSRQPVADHDPPPDQDLAPDPGMRVLVDGIPARTFTTLWHVGSMRHADKGTTHNRLSLEGDGLSVSTCPEDWRRIAKLGGQPTWSLRRDGNRFLDAHRLGTARRRDILAWATDHDVVVPTPTWRVIVTDEDGASGYMEFTSRERAFEEADGDASAVRRARGWTAGAAMVAILGRTPDPVEVVDHALAIWAAQDPRFDGVVWNDRHDPGAYSAPRAVIARDRVPVWSAERVAD